MSHSEMTHATAVAVDITLQRKSVLDQGHSPNGKACLQQKKPLTGLGAT